MTMTTDNKFDFKIKPSDRNINDFILNKQIGDGSCGKVYECQDKITNDIFAIKMININILDVKKQIDNEIYVQYSYTHRHIVKISEWFYDKEKIYILMEYAPCSDLYNYTKYMEKIPHEQLIISYMKQLLNCLMFLRENKIIHRDLKPENIMVFDNGLTLKISDFGLCFIATNNYPCNDVVGTVEFVSPEAVAKKEYDCRADIWSLGVILCEMVTGDVPSFCTRGRNNEDNIKLGDREIDFQCDTHFKTLCHDLIKKMLVVNPNERIGLEECLEYIDKMHKTLHEILHKDIFM